ncbi:translation elongation factor Ts [Cutibacterium acnes JCM 18920]|nr:translation elongation factor Ts [Cutibacterium acnes JCM 18920]
MAITAAEVKKLRDATGAGMMDAKKALTEPTATSIRPLTSCVFLELLRLRSVPTVRPATAWLLPLAPPWCISALRPTSSPRTRSSSPLPTRSPSCRQGRG